MPVGNAYGVGRALSARAFATRRRSVTLSDGSATNGAELLVAGLPHLYFWIRQTSVVDGSTVQPQFMVRADTGAAAPQDEWLDLTPAQTLAPNVPLIIREEMVAVKIRLVFTRASGVGSNVVIQYVLAGSA
jgi:hypothetical protein